jgi:hypothetical protein
MVVILFTKYLLSWIKGAEVENVLNSSKILPSDFASCGTPDESRAWKRNRTPQRTDHAKDCTYTRLKDV